MPNYGEIVKQYDTDKDCEKLSTAKMSQMYDKIVLEDEGGKKLWQKTGDTFCYLINKQLMN